MVTENGGMHKRDGKQVMGTEKEGADKEGKDIGMSTGEGGGMSTRK